ncbi:MAG: zinc-ribbon and DUF3426 domain-containing protein [Gammaproteobacteria bacterium]|nr:zinc-ribbon and DUF3426 domain-containing protein [Gammaproteobacteria bacterium]
MTEPSPRSTVGCPHCGTRFQVHRGDLAAAEGRLRCGACLKVFRVVEAMDMKLIDEPDRLRASFPAWVVVGLFLAVAALAVQITWLQTDYRARNLKISGHAESPGALAVQFVVIHDAPIPAPLPTLDVEFATADGEPVGSRRFRPGDYLDSEPLATERLARMRLLAPETAHPVTLNIPHPGALVAQVTISFPSRFTIGW